ncbi:DUF5906 domain-containing protein [Herminiimonas sp. CN]|uniref:DUF5906 domain-containing protein n=1 Tax=Herminiimonas sp. CN TaxID=1349818 RepID=UPI0004735D03|nr:DUF5906 domain-containing protein [Herminiimonas sp. CN]
MQLTFLKAPVPLTKSYAKKADGTINKTSYPNVYEVTSITEDATDLHHMEILLKKHAVLGHCLVKGNPTRALSCESRAGTTDSNATTEWIVLDLDGIPNVSTIDDFLKALRLGDVSYIVQWSASYGIENKELRAHIYMWLDKPVPAQLIKQWLIQLNHTISILRDAMGLTKTGNAISWPLDISACQNDKLLYIAPPLLKGIKDPLGKTPRISYVRKTNETLIVPGTIHSSEQNRMLTAKRINEIRAVLGYPPRKTTYKMHGNTEVMNKPDSCIVTDMKIERGFVYFNLNGGDSWGYFHPEDNPDYIHNFKGEPAYVTKELLPEYWQSLTTQAVRVSSQGVTYLAFCDSKTGAYWRGTHDAQTDTLDINEARNETQVRHFAKQHGMPLGDYIPEWELTFDPQDNVKVDPANKSINTFQPTEYMQHDLPKKAVPCPKTIHKVIHHALGCDDKITEHFMNWVAFILQFRDRTKTAWVMHGRTGTGKGVLMDSILRPLFGQAQTAVRQAESLNEKYNEYLKNCFIVFIDEIEAKALINERGVMAKLKNFITEKFVAVRLMRNNSVEVRNYTNWIFASNKTDPVMIDKEDRRFNVGKYQPERLVITQQEIEQTIPKELQGFHDYLMQYQVDAAQAGTPIESDDRDNMISISELSVDTIGSALINGNFEMFMNERPTSDKENPNGLQANRDHAYDDVLKAILARTDRADGSCNIARDELHTLFDYTAGGMPQTSNKFTSLLKHHRIHLVKVRIDKPVMGMRVEWKDVKNFRDYELQITPLRTAPKLRVMK